MQELKPCTRFNRCRQYRICDACARARQAHVADLAEGLLSKYSAVFMARFTPENNTKPEIERLKAAIKRQLANFDAIWSIEQGEESKLLHINLLSPKDLFKTPKASEYWQGQQASNIRQAAAYMVKRNQIPAIESYSGRQFGSFQNLKDLFTIQSQSPIIQAAHAEQFALAGWPLPTTYVERQKAIEEMRSSSKTHLEIANDNLPKFRAYVASLRGNQNYENN